MSTTSDLQGRRLDALRAWTSVRRARRRRRGAGAARDPAAAGSARSRVSRATSRRRRSTDESEAARLLARLAAAGARSSRVEDELRRTAEDGDLVLAVTDAQTRILWTYGGRVMRRKAESVNFVPAARWDDESVGTNALDLANRLARPSMVFSAEHYAPIVHNWVCWAAPVNDPVTGAQLGVIDLSTTWDRTHPIGLATARVLARLIETAMPLSATHPTLARRRRSDRASSSGCSATPRPRSTAAGCCSTGGRPRSSRSSRCTPTGSRSTASTRSSTATRPSPSRRSRPRCPTCAPRSAASSPRVPTG